MIHVIQNIINYFNGKVLFGRNDELSHFFSRHRLPTDVLRERGAVLRLSVWDEDYMKKDDFIGECFVTLPSIQQLKSLASLRDVPVLELPLRRPHKNNQPRVFEVTLPRERKRSLF